MKKALFSNLKGDFAGAFASAVVALPGNIAYGAIAFAPLGPEYIGQGVLAGMFSTVFAGFFAGFLGGTKAMVTGPQAPTAIVFGSAIGQLMSLGIFNGPEPDFAMLLTIMFGITLLSGLIQLVFGYLKVGTLVKFIPYPVIAGILSGTGVLIVKSQLWNFLGVEEQTFSELIRHYADLQPLTMVVAVFTGLLMWRGAKLFPKNMQIPSAILGIIGGTGLYYLFDLIGLGDNLGKIIGNVPSGYPTPDYLFSFFKYFSNGETWNIFFTLISTAATLAVLSSIDTLLSSVSMQSQTNVRSDTNKELKAQGLGTIVASFFGGLPGTGYTNRSFINWQSGGRTKMSLILHSVIILLLILFFSKVIGFIPQAVMAGLLILIGFQMLYGYFLHMLKDLNFEKLMDNKELIFNVSIVLLVTLVTILSDLIKAVGVGIIVSIVVFVVQMSKSPIRRVLRASTFHSHKQRFDKLMKILNKEGDRIAIVELEGSLFFGSADNLATISEDLSNSGVECIILDMKRITSIDSTGARLMKQTFKSMKTRGVVTYISYVAEDSHTIRFLEDFEVLEEIEKGHIFGDTNMALEYAEDQLLAKIAPEELHESKISINSLIGLEDPELAFLIIDYIERLEYEKNTMVFEQGAKADGIYFIFSGTAEMSISLPGLNTVKRLQTLSFGTYFGELALFGEQIRTVNIEAIDRLVCYRITLTGFSAMQKEQPELVMAILNTINKTMTSRLSQAYKMISELES